MYILDTLNKIKLNKNLNLETYTIIYLDKIEKEIKFKKIKSFNSLTLTIEKRDNNIQILIHRIKEIKQEDKIIWKR
tara:strand:- start:274 stop:501 length:228 start_codon:yes stop_codon:yes gene_type:complete